MKNQIIENSQHAYEYGIDKPEITEWKWPCPLWLGPGPARVDNGADLRREA